ncbi:putative Nibrin [Tripterygium wilfordii]|uniref:Putative Nibrin n=1 Tax=Tripterygium wilfordii TaxID=458696 RepID=A0A7J7DM95_TRIWF|nr:nijmegen breakage syndrome 1 protein [Tripterygium wilfordii]XP_038701353.1 nijmegen breakage syndrome 1 protein [Tripterygium wilfordii]KAF5747451.1 putative Nibrin [Tripterygium wilfordii]
MVWALLTTDPLSGEDNYYIFKKGIYKVGRKGCDIIINKDKGVSRVHAEIVVDAMTSLNPLHKNSDISSKVRIRDCSKYGTFINKNLGSREKVHEFPNKETTLTDGDLVSFGTGNATYRFSFVLLTFFVCYPETFEMNQLLEERITSIGACLTQFSQEFTHMLVDDLTPVKEVILDAIIGKKPLVLSTWVELLAQTRICSEIPSWSSYAPTLSVDGVSVKVVDSKTRGNCLARYSFLLEPADKYFFGHRLHSLLKLGGANVITKEEFCLNSQGFEYGEDNLVVCVIPRGSAEFNSSNKFSSLSRMNEMDLVCAILSGHLDPSMLISPSLVVLSSCSTDETVVADSDAEVETLTSPLAPANGRKEESPKDVSRVEISMDHATAKLEDIHAISSVDNSGGMIARNEKVDESGSSDVIYSQDLVVRDLNPAVSITSCMPDSGALNFKKFKKVNIESGNSFSNLIPFSKYPYQDSDNRDEEMSEFMKEEKKRKRLEATAEDLFNNEKGKRRRAAGSLHGLFTHG